MKCFPYCEYVAIPTFIRGHRIGKRSVPYRGASGREASPPIRPHDTPLLCYTNLLLAFSEVRFASCH